MHSTDGREPPARPDAPVPPHRQHRCTFRVSGHGVDSITYALRDVDDDAIELAFAQPACLDAATGEILPIAAKGCNRFLVEPATGLRLIFRTTPSGHRLLSTEGRLAPLLSGSVDDRTLADPSRIAYGATRACAIARRLGVPIEASAMVTVSRVDLAADAAFDDPSDGRRFLAALDTLELPHYKRHAISGRGNLRETVFWEGKKGIFARGYDKALEAAQKRPAFTEPRGSIVRVERQVREPKKRQRLAADLAPAELANLFGKTFRPWCLDRLVVASPSHVAAEIIGRIGTDVGGRVLTLSRAERLVGTATVMAAVGPHPYDDRTIARRRSDLRAVGVAVDPDAATPLDIADVLRALIAAWDDAA